MKKNIFVERAGFVISLAAVIAALAAVFGTRLHLWDFRAGFLLLKWAAYGGVTGATASLVSIILFWARRPRHNLLWPVLGLLLGVVVVAIPFNIFSAARVVPPIHDISTDTVSPPEFVKILPLRKNAPNPSSYGGQLIAQAQIQAYPDIVPLTFDAAPDAVFDKALTVARSMGWRIVDADKEEGRIEAVDETFWFRFKDDVVIRIKKTDSRTRLDIRSVSRVGTSDLGTNAGRIRKFLQAMGGPV